MTHLQRATISQRELIASPQELLPDFKPWFAQSREPQEPAGVWEPARIGTIPDDLDLWSDRT